MCLRCRPVSLTRRLRSLPALLHVILGRLAYPCRPHGRFPSGLDAGNWGRGPRWRHTASVVQNAGQQWRAARHGKGASLGPHCSVGNRPIAVLQRLLNPETRSPDEVFCSVRRVSGVLGGQEKDAGFPASSSHAIAAEADFIENFGSLQAYQFGLV